MASGDDRIDVIEMESVGSGAGLSSAGAVKRYEPRESDDDDDDHDKSSIADKNAPYDGAGAMSAKVHRSDRKIGHRRVGEGGEITYKKIQSTQIMGSIQLGIQHAVGGLASKPERDLLMQDFMTVETTNFPHEGSNHTPAHHYSEFRFRTYAPIAFRYFRDLFGIQPDDFLMSMCSAPLRELSNPGASGSIFYLTQDDEFIIKTVQHKEGEFLQKLLPGYYMNLNQNPRTLLPKFFGLYCYQCNSKNVRLVAMNNLLPSVVRLHQKYDLKGSTYKRKSKSSPPPSATLLTAASVSGLASKSERNKSSPTYKDLDFMEHHPEGIFLEADTYAALIKTMQRDCRVLESFKIMDYSLLVGIHNLDEAQRAKLEERQRHDAAPGDDDDDARPQLDRSRSINRQRLVAHSTAMESIQAESEPIDEEEDVPPGGIPARNARGERLLLFVGVIDILQSYRLRKKLEHTWKSMIHDGDTVSVHRPGFYAQRFLDFMAKNVFKKIPSLDLPEIKGNHRKFRTLVTSYIALKHSPSKRKSISRPIRPLEDVDTPGRKQSAVGFAGRPIVDFAAGVAFSHSSCPSARSSLSALTDTTESTWRPPRRPAVYPAVLADRPRDDERRARIESLSAELMAPRVNGSLADSGIQTDSTQCAGAQADAGRSLRDASVDTRNENSLQDIPFIDEDEAGAGRASPRARTAHRSLVDIPERVDEATSTGELRRERERERHSGSLGRERSPTFVERCRRFFAELGLSGTPSAASDASARLRPHPGEPSPPAPRDAHTLPKNMRFRKTQGLYVKNAVGERISEPLYRYRTSSLERRSAALDVDINVERIISDRQSPMFDEKSTYDSLADGSVSPNRPDESRGRGGHVSVVKVNGLTKGGSRETFLTEVVFSSEEEIISQRHSGSTVILVHPPAE